MGRIHLVVLVGLAACGTKTPTDDADTDADTDETPRPEVPRVLSVRLGPEGAHHGDRLQCTARAGTPDTRLSFAWTVDGALLPDNTTETLHVGFLERGDVVGCTVTPTLDGRVGESVTDTLVIGNTPPSAPRVALQPGPVRDADDILCSVVEPAEDHEGDPITYRFRWVEQTRGSSFPGLAISDVENQLPADRTRTGDVWACTVVAWDGSDESGIATAIDEVLCDQHVVYPDEDGDGFGVTDAGFLVCDDVLPPSTSVVGGDCMDDPMGGAAFSPDAEEPAGSGLDANCDGFVACYRDDDHDGRFSTEATALPVTPGAYRPCKAATGDAEAPGDDCDDTDPLVKPGALERCNGIDDDCDPTSPDLPFSWDPGFPQQPLGAFDDLQTLVDAVPAGAVIDVCPGVPPVHVAIPRPVHFRGRIGVPTPVWGDGLGPVFEVLPDVSLVLHDLVVSGGRAAHGGGLHAHPGSEVLLDGVRFVQNRADVEGGALHLEGTSEAATTLRVAGLLQLDDNRAVRGGALSLVGAVSADLENVDIVSNEASEEGGGVWLAGGAHLTLRNSRLEDNLAEGHGGAVYAVDTPSTLVLVDSTIAGNRAVDGDGGAFAMHGAELTWQDVLVAGNRAPFGEGGALWCLDCTLRAPFPGQVFGLIRENVAARGGAIRLDGEACAELVGDGALTVGRMAGNVATEVEGGGGLLVDAQSRLWLDQVAVTWPGSTTRNTADGVSSDLRVQAPDERVVAVSGLLHGAWEQVDDVWTVDPAPLHCP